MSKALEAGRELDAMIAERVFGCVVRRHPITRWWLMPNPDGHGLIAVPRFSTDMNAAEALARRVGLQTFTQEEGESLPLAICRAALLALPSPRAVEGPSSTPRDTTLRDTDDQWLNPKRYQ